MPTILTQGDRASPYSSFAQYYREGDKIVYPKAGPVIKGPHHCDICLRTKTKRDPRLGTLDSGIHVGDHHAVDLQGPYTESLVYNNIYNCGIIEYKSRHVTMFFVKTKDQVQDCIKSYCEHELAILRARNPELAKRTILFTIDGGESKSAKVRRILATHGAEYRTTLAYTPEQNSLI